MARARLLFTYACIKREDLDRGTTGADDFLHEALVCDEGDARTEDNKLSAFERDWNSLLLRGAEIPLRQYIVKERDLVATLADGAAAPLTRAFAAAYVTLKSAAMHAVCGNAVAGPVEDRFDRFTSALSVLDHIYDLRRLTFDEEDAFVTVSRAQIELGSRLLPRALFRASRKSMGLGPKDGLRPFAKQWNTARWFFEANHSKLVLSFQRTDFLNDADAFHHISEVIINERAEWERSLSATIVGLDLCGPEALDIVTIGAQLGDRAPTGMILDPIDRIFELRERLSTDSAREIYVSFHAGEHVVDWELGFLATLAILTDPRFDARSDRLSHALILCVPAHEWPTASNATRSARGAARDRVRENCNAGKGLLFSKAELTLIVEALDDLLTGDHLPLHRVCDVVRGKVVSGEIAIEICPYSNLMIRNIPPEQHPWLDAVATGRVLVGTDDPSLTQTLPWIEEAALKVGAREIQ